jgi:hypothetical protein
LSRSRAMQFGMNSGAGVATSGVTIPALMLYAPLSSISVRAGGGGPDDLVRRGGAIVFRGCGGRGGRLVGLKNLKYEKRKAAIRGKSMLIVRARAIAVVHLSALTNSQRNHISISVLIMSCKVCII